MRRDERSEPVVEVRHEGLRDALQQLDVIVRAACLSPHSNGHDDEVVVIHGVDNPVGRTTGDVDMDAVEIAHTLELGAAGRPGDFLELPDQIGRASCRERV